MKFLEIAIVRLDEILLYVGKVDHVAVAEITIRAIDAGQGLEEVVSIEFPTEVKPLQPWRVEACQQHFVHDEKIYRFRLLELGN